MSLGQTRTIDFSSRATTVEPPVVPPTIPGGASSLTGPPALPRPPVKPRDTQPPKLTRLRVGATHRAVTVHASLSERARVVVRLKRRRATIARKTFAIKSRGTVVLRVRHRIPAARLTVQLKAIDAAGNARTRALRLRVR
jgi:hypothetical protein